MLDSDEPGVILTYGWLTIESLRWAAHKTTVPSLIQEGNQTLFSYSKSKFPPYAFLIVGNKDL